MTENTSIGSPELKATGSHGNKEYRFYGFPKGNPPGQVKAFVREGRDSYERRVPFDKLPTEALQRTFIAATGKSADAIGLVILR